jgi:hypothetical protein
MKCLPPLVLLFILFFVNLGSPTPIVAQIDTQVAVDAPLVTDGLWGWLVAVARDSSWQSIGVVAAVVVAFLIHRQQTLKALSYGVLSRPLLTTATKAVKGRVQILLDEQQIESPLLILLKIVNSGNLNIESKDLDQPLVATLNGEILSSSISYTSPKGLREYVKWNVVDGKQLKFDNMLLNKGDCFEVQVLIDNPSMVSKPSATLEGRIVGVKEIKEVRYETITQSQWTLGQVMIAGITIAIILLLLGLLLLQNETWLDFGYLLSSDEYFRSGFMSGIVLVLGFVIILQLLIKINVQIRKIKQLLQPSV